MLSELRQLNHQIKKSISPSVISNLIALVAYLNPASISHNPIDLPESPIFPKNLEEYSLVIPMDDPLLGRTEHLPYGFSPRDRLTNGPLADDWYLKVTGVSQLQEIGLPAANKTIAVLDSGGIGTVKGRNIIDNNDDTSPETDHGPAITSIIQRSYPEARVMQVKVISGRTGLVTDLVSGIYYAVNNGAEILSISLSVVSEGQTTTDYVCNALTYAQQRKVLIVAAAGNSGTSQPSYPADCPNFGLLMSVGGTNVDGSPASFSNYGSNVTISAPAIGFMAKDRFGQPYPARGTSFAVPQGAAIAAMLLAMDDGISTEEVVTRILRHADPPVNIAINDDPNRGKPRIRADQAFFQAKISQNDNKQLFIPQVLVGR